jgi:site-specific DNA recombinase
MLQAFEQYRVAFVSVTQQFNTSTSMGRLVLNILLSFARFKREIIAERTRDKIAATRRKGRWSDGRPLLGFDVDPRDYLLVVNADEAERVRQIFGLYLEHRALGPVVEELERRGWTNKRWTIRSGQQRGGRTLTKPPLHRMLTNVLYSGQVRYKDEVHAGEQPALVDPAVFARVQDLLRCNGRGTDGPGNRFGALLKGLLHCGFCVCAMTPAHSTKGDRRYRYYAYSNAQKRGWQKCPTKSVPAAEIERVVVDRIRCVGRDPALRAEVLTQSRAQGQARTADLEGQERTLAKDLTAWNGADTRPALPVGRVPRVSRLEALALRFEGLVRTGAVANYSRIATLGQVTRDRISQVMNLLNLAPDLLEEILFLPRTVSGRDPIHLALLQPIAGTFDWQKQRRMWRELCRQQAASPEA